MSDRLTLATTTGLPWLALVFHFGTGLVALVSGFLAIAVRKGGPLHRRSGTVFVYSMIATGITAAGIAFYSGRATAIGGVLTAYLVFTAYTAVKPLASEGRRIDVALMILAFILAVPQFSAGITALGLPGRQRNGVPAGMMLFLATVTLFAAVGDARMLRAGALVGSKRIARHLWRMCFGLFIASGSFFLGQMKFIPEQVRIMPLVFTAALFPLGALVYWMWRVRLRRNVRGMLVNPVRP